MNETTTTSSTEPKERTIFERLMEVQKELPTISRDKTNPFAKNKYASLENILSVVMPILHKHDFLFTSNLSVDTETGKQILTTLLVDVLTDESIECQFIIDTVKPQELGSLLTYYRRYGISTMLSISSADEDDDAESVAKPGKPPSNKRQPQDKVSKPYHPEAGVVSKGIVNMSNPLI